MYDELVKGLRELQYITAHCSENWCAECANKELCDKHDNKTLSRTYKEAADAIEELSKEVESAFTLDKISLKTAFETDVWAFVWAAEPTKKILVQMTYDDLWRIVQRMRNGDPLVDNIRDGAELPEPPKT